MVYDGKKDKEFLKREYFHYKSKTYVGHSQALDILNTIEFIERYNGIPIVAHPDNLSLEELVYLKRKGIKGIEVYSPKFEDEEIKERKMWAENLRLFVTGGSDGDEKYEPLPFFKFKQLFDVYGLRFKYL